MIHDKKKEKKKKTNQVTHFFYPLRRFVFFSFDPFPWKGESHHQWDCPRYTSSVVRHLLLYLVCFTLFGYFHTVSHITLVIFYLFLLPLALERGGARRARSLYCFRFHFFSSIEMLGEKL